MVGITLEELQARLVLYREAERKTLLRQEFWVEGRRVTYADLRTIVKQIKSLEDSIKRLTRNTRRVRYVGSR